MLVSEVKATVDRQTPMLDVLDGQTINFNILDKRSTGTYKMPFAIKRDGDKLWLNYGFSKTLTEELKKNLDGMTWHGFKDPPIKKWSCKYCEHNMFRFAFLAGLDPYAPFDRSPILVDTPHPLKAHQIEMASTWLATHATEWAADMGLGKSLSAIAAVEHMFKHGYIPPDSEVFWVATKSALISVQLEYEKWGCRFPVRFLTYEALKKYTETIDAGTKPPRVLIGDEAHKLKHGTTQRTAAFAHVARAMRTEYGDACFTLLMTGTPAPKSPIDWYSQCEILCPGYLKEGNIHSFKSRLAIIKQKESSAGAGMYPELISWRDDSRKCDECGKFADDFEHSFVDNMDAHRFTPSTNEVEMLYQRMKGLVIVKTKAECLDLPEKIYRKVYCKAAASTLRAMKMIAAVQPSAIQVLTRLRELSDGFQYTEVEDGRKKCELCTGSGKYVNYEYIGPTKTNEYLHSLVMSVVTSDPDSSANRKRNKLLLNIESAISPEDVIIDPTDFPELFAHVPGDCPNCDGLGDVPNVVRSWRDTATSKDKALIDILEDHEDVGRLVIYAGFKASIDRVVGLCKDNDWHYIRLDGRGWLSDLEGKPTDLIKTFQDRTLDKKIVFIGHPASASTGLTLTASPSIVYYSNDFAADARQQSEDRIHRMGMDENRGATIIDLIHLPTDEYVLENLRLKKRLQDMSLGQLIGVMDNELPRADYA